MKIFQRGVRRPLSKPMKSQCVHTLPSLGCGLLSRERTVSRRFVHAVDDITNLLDIRLQLTDALKPFL